MSLCFFRRTVYSKAFGHFFIKIIRIFQQQFVHFSGQWYAYPMVIAITRVRIYMIKQQNAIFSCDTFSAIFNMTQFYIYENVCIQNVRVQRLDIKLNEQNVYRVENYQVPIGNTTRSKKNMHVFDYRKLRVIKIPIKEPNSVL